MKLLTSSFLILFIFIIVSCSSHKHKSIITKSSNTYFLEGKIEGKDSGMVFLGAYDTTIRTPLILFDSAKISGSYFHFQGLLPTPLICKLKVAGLEYSWPYTHYFVLDAGITHAQLFKDSMANSVIRGSVLNEQLLDFYKKLNGLEITFQRNFPLNKQGIITDDSLQILQEAFYRDKHNLILGQIETNPTVITSAFIAREILSDKIDLSLLEEICNALGSADNYFARYLSLKLEAAKRTITGMQAPSFKMTDNKNITFTNDSFKRKYLLLDFWASWCKPCREESPNLVEAYKKYADKGLEIISISVDHNKDEWKKAIKEDALSWIQVCVGPHSKIEKSFGTNFLPSNFLINPHGKIIAKNLTGADVEKTLDFWIDKNK